MLNELTTIRWFNAKKKAWTTDYINTKNDDNHYVISTLPSSSSLPKFQFVMPRKMVDDMYTNLQSIMQIVLRQRDLNAKNFKIINLGVNGMTCDSKYVTGKFEILKQQ